VETATDGVVFSSLLELIAVETDDVMLAEQPSIWRQGASDERLKAQLVER